MIFDMTSAAGAESKDAETKCPAIVGNTDCRLNTYNARTFDATVAIPAVRIVHTSDGVIRLRYGLTVRVDSIPTKILLAATRDSAPDILINVVNTYAKPLIIKVIMPR